MHKYILLFLDWLLINGAFMGALALDTGQGIDDLLSRPDIAAPVVGFVVLYSVFILVLFDANNLYKISVYLRVGQHVVQIVKSLVYAIIGIALFAFLLGERLPVDGRTFIVYFFHLSVGLITLMRVGIFRNLFRYASEHGLIRRRTLVVGSGPAARRLITALGNKNPYGLFVVGLLEWRHDPAGQASARLPVFGKIADVDRVVREQDVKEIILALDDVSDEEFWEIADSCARTKALLLVAATDQFSVIPGKIYQEEYGDVPVFGVMNFAPYLGAPWLRRLADLFLASVGIILLLPLYIMVALAIKIESRGAVIFAQQRVGKDGRPFLFYKFRSMIVGSDVDIVREEKLKDFINEGKNGNGNGNGKGSSTKIVDESKVTRVGRFIRKKSIDELPQLFNVIKGDMSLIGPRPCLPYEWKHYEPWHRRRMAVKPGCTGLWQALARSQVGFRDMVILDLYYVYNASFHLDIWLLLRTIPVILFSTGGK